MKSKHELIKILRDGLQWANDHKQSTVPFSSFSLSVDQVRRFLKSFNPEKCWVLEESTGDFYDDGNIIAIFVKLPTVNKLSKIANIPIKKASELKKQKALFHGLRDYYLRKVSYGERF